MSDEEITIKVTTNVDASDVESLEKSIKQLSDNIVDVSVSTDNSEIDNLQKDLDQIDGSKLDIDIDAETSKLEELSKLSNELKEKLNYLKKINIGVHVYDKEIAKLEKELKDLDKKKLEISANIDDAKIKLAEKEINNLNGKKPQVNVDVDGSELDSVERKITGMDGKRIGVEIDVDDSQLSNAQAKVQGLGDTVVNELGQTNNAITGLVSGLAGKSIWDTIYGTSKKAETNKVLISNMADATKSANELYKTVDKTTDKSLMSMQQVIPAINAIKAATGTTAGEINEATPKVAKFGEYVLALTGSSAQAENAMFSLSKGIKGAYASLDQYGITEDALMRTGLWNGKEDDLNGFLDAVNAVTGSTDELMETTTGLEALMGKAYSRAGKKIGKDVLPVVKNLLNEFINLDGATGGWLSTIILGAGGVATFGSSLLSAIGQAGSGIRELKTGWKLLFGGTLENGKEVVGVFSRIKSAMNDIKNVDFGNIINSLKGIKDTGKSLETTTEVASNVKFTVENSDEAIDAGKSVLDTVENVSETNKEIQTDAKVLNDELKTTQKVVDEMGSTGDIADGMADVADNVGGTTKGASKIGSVAPEAAVAGAEMEATSVSLGSIATGAMSMLAPLLELSIVIAVMIPVVTLLVAEAMLCIKALQLLLVSLSFDSVDLSGTVKALKQIGEAIWEICKAMATMVVASYLTMLYQGMSAIMLFNDPIKIAVDELKKTATLVKGFADITIPESVPANLQALTTSLGAVAKAMWSLQSVGVSVLAGSVLTLNGILGTLSQNLGVAKRELSESAKQINSMSELDTIDEGVASKLEAVTSSLANVGKAMGALSDVNWDINMGNIVNLGGVFGTITSHLGDAKDEIVKAAPVINEFSSLPDIDQSAGEKLKKVTDGIKNVADSLKSLNSLSKSMGTDNGAIGGILKKLQLGTTIRIAKSTLTDTAKQLGGLKDLPDIPDGIKTKLSKIGSTTTTVINTLKPLTKIQNMNVNSANIASKVAQARYAISNSAIHLASLSGISTIPDDIPAKLSKIGSTATTLINSLKPLVNIANMNINSAGIVSKIAQARYAVSNSVIHLVSLSGIGTIPDDVPTKLSKVGSTAATLINTLKPLTSIANMNVNAGAITTKIAQARYAISNSATHIASLAGISTIPEIVSENLNRVSTSARQVATAATNLNTIPVVANASLNVMLAVTAIKTAITQLNSLSGTSLNGGIGALLTSVTNALNQLKTTLYAMSGGFSSAGASIGASIVTGVRTGMSGLSSSVRSSVSGAINSSAGTASSGGKRLGTNVTTGFKSTLHLSGAMRTEMSNVISAINNGISEAKRVAEQGAEGIVQAFKNGLQVGSPGEMYWTMVGEYNYIKDMMKGTVGLFSHLSENLGTAMVDSFGVSGQGGLSDSVNGGLIPIGNNPTNSPTINIYVDGNINDEDTMDSLVDKLTRALTWSNATGNRSV